MNILYITNHFNIGGITSYILVLATGMKKKGHVVYVASSGGQLLGRFVKEGVKYIPIPIRTKKEISPKILISVFKLNAAVREYNIDIVHSHSRTTQVAGCLLSRMTGIPHISTCHGFFRKRFLRRAFPCWGRKVIAISEAVKEHLVKDFRVDEKNIAVIHNGIDVEKFRVQSAEFRVQRKKDLGLTDGPVIGIVARLSEEKGHLCLVEAMKEVLKKNFQAQLLIVGEGKRKEELVKRTSNLGITGNTLFLPSLEDTSAVLSVMDIFVLPSLKEGLGLSLMEAMAAGLPVIGSRVGGIKSLIQDNHNGLLFESQDVKQLSHLILRLLGDYGERKRLGENAQVFMRKNFSQEKTVAQTEKVYSECVFLKS